MNFKSKDLNFTTKVEKKKERESERERENENNGANVYIT